MKRPRYYAEVVSSGGGSEKWAVKVRRPNDPSGDDFYCTTWSERAARRIARLLNGPWCIVEVSKGLITDEVHSADVRVAVVDYDALHSEGGQERAQRIRNYHAELMRLPPSVQRSRVLAEIRAYAAGLAAGKAAPDGAREGR